MEISSAQAAVIRGAVPADLKGYGSGYGYGSGDGYGDGSVYGYGSGDGYGSAAYWLRIFNTCALTWPAKQREHLDHAVQHCSVLAFWRSDEKGNPTNGGSKIDAAEPGIIHKSEGPLNLCSPGTLHATMDPEKWKGQRVWVVALYGECTSDGEKYGALHREIIGEIVVPGSNYGATR